MSFCDFLSYGYFLSESSGSVLDHVLLHLIDSTAHAIDLDSDMVEFVDQHGPECGKGSFKTIAFEAAKLLFAHALSSCSVLL